MDMANRTAFFGKSQMFVIELNLVPKTLRSLVIFVSLQKEMISVLKH